MERNEPTFVPEWYKSSSSSATGSGNSNHQTGSTLQSGLGTDELNVCFSSKSRLAVGISDNDASRSLAHSERIPPYFRRSSSSTDYVGWEKDGPSRAYNDFGRSHRDWDRDREKDLENQRDRSFLPDNGFDDYPDVLNHSKSEKNSSRRSQSFLLGKRSDSWLKRAGHDSVASKISNLNKSSFEREFPSLVGEEKHVGSELPRVSSPGLSTAIHNLPVTASTIIGSDGWTSALAEVPPIAGENSFIVSSAVQATTILSPNASSTSAGLNMAETVAQAPVRACTAPQLPGDHQKIEELHRQQIRKLRPMTPSLPKNLGLNLAEKSKTKGVKLPEYSSVKLGQHSTSQLVNYNFRSNVRSDSPKSPQPGNFQVLNRGKNGAFPADKDNSHSRNGNRVATTSSQVIPKLNNVDGRANASTSSSFGEKKPPQTQNRNDFFNSLRKKTSSSSQETINQDLSLNSLAPNLEKLDDASSKAKDVSLSISTYHCSLVDGNSSENCVVVEEPKQLVPDKEEEAFLRSLGWEDNDREEALTPEEIESFLSEYEKRVPASKLKAAGWSTKLSSSSDTEVEASFCKGCDCEDL